MRKMISILFLFFLCATEYGHAVLKAGWAKQDITPPSGTPSAGYQARHGEGMQGTHDPLWAIALFLDNGYKKIVLCSVDHLGFSYDMVQQVREQVQAVPELEHCDLYIGASHTHSGGGAYLDLPEVGEQLAGKFQEKIKNYYVDQTARAIIEASRDPVTVKVGLGYGLADLSRYRGQWPIGLKPLPDVALIKVTTLEGAPLAAVFHYAVHPTVLTQENRLFSADFVGYAREHLKELLGGDVQPLFFNGAQGDVAPLLLDESDRFGACDGLGLSLAQQVKKIWAETSTSESLSIETERQPYSFKPQPTPTGLSLPLNSYATEVNLIVLNGVHAFLTVPGELSCAYGPRLKDSGTKLGYDRVSILGLVNDAHGYLLLPEAWAHKTAESRLSFGGEKYGEEVCHRLEVLLQHQAPAFP